MLHWHWRRAPLLARQVRVRWPAPRARQRATGRDVRTEHDRFVMHGCMRDHGRVSTEDLAFLIVPARPRAGRGGRRARSVECAGEREVRAWNRPGGGSGGPRRERVRVCDRYGAYRAGTDSPGRLQGLFPVDTYSRTYRGTYSLTTHEYRHYTSQTDTNLDRGAHVATRRRSGERLRRFARFAPARVTFLTVTFRQECEHSP